MAPVHVELFLYAAKATAGLKRAYEARHLVEVRHLQQWGLNIRNAPAVMLERMKHQELTNALRNTVPYDLEYTPAKVWNELQTIYAQHPTWLKAIEHYFK